MDFKTCTACDVEQPIENFGSRMKRGKPTIPSWCKPCKRIYDRNVIQNDPVRRAKLAAAKKPVREDNMAFIYASLEGKACSCGSTIGLRYERAGSISPHIVAGRFCSRATVEASIRSSTVVCSSCQGSKGIFNWMLGQQLAERDSHA